LYPKSISQMDILLRYFVLNPRIRIKVLRGVF
jgi:hypothetical protein